MFYICVSNWRIKLRRTYTPGWPSSCGSASWTSYLLLDMHLVINARIHVFSSVSPLAPLFGGGWKATLRPSCRSFSPLLSFLTLASRGVPPLGPTDPRGGSVMETVFLTGLRLEAGPLDGEVPRCRVFRLPERTSRNQFLKCYKHLPGG